MCCASTWCVFCKFLPSFHPTPTVTKQLKWGRFSVLRWLHVCKFICEEKWPVLCVYIFKTVFLFCNGKWMKSFCALKVLIVSASCFNGRRVRPVAEREQLYLRLHRRPGNFMLYLRTFHVFCLPCQTSFQPLIRWNGKRMTAALMSVISFWNRFRNGKMPGPAVTTRRSITD